MVWVQKKNLTLFPDCDQKAFNAIVTMLVMLYVTASLIIKHIVSSLCSVVVFVDQRCVVREGAMKSCSAGGFDKRNKMKKKKRMRGLFMCQSAATMASMVCMSHDNGKSSSVIVPRKKITSSNQSQSDDTSSSLSSTAAKYVRLVQSPSSDSSNKRRSSAAKQTTNHHLAGEQQQPTSTIASILSTSRPESVKDDVLQIVVMKVSIHCQGCAEKVKKHISKMEGVTSFSIDVETKRVIVMGHVSPDRVLESLSKVKKAELWTL